MVTKELIDFVRAEFAKGTTKQTLMTLLMSQGWAALDTQEAFNAAEQQSVSPTPIVPIAPNISPVVNTVPVQKSGQGVWVVVIVFIAICIGLAGAFLWFKTDVFKVLFMKAPTSNDSSGIIFDTISVVEDAKVPVSVDESEKDTSVVAPVVVAENNFNKDEIIAAILKSQATLKALDVVGFRSYMLAKATTTIQKQQITNTSDKDLTLAMNLMVALQPEINKEMLVASTTVFSEKNKDLIEVGFLLKDGKTKSTLFVNRANGVWY